MLPNTYNTTNKTNRNINPSCIRSILSKDQKIDLIEKDRSFFGEYEVFCILSQMHKAILKKKYLSVLKIATFEIEYIFGKSFDYESMIVFIVAIKTIDFLSRSNRQKIHLLIAIKPIKKLGQTDRKRSIHLIFMF